MRGSQIYEDFVIRFESEPSGSGYQAQVTTSPRGPSKPIALNPLLFERCVRFWETLDSAIWRGATETAALPRDVRTSTATEIVDPGHLGGQLFEALFIGSIRESFISSFASVNSQEGRGLRISLELAPEVAGAAAALPWELLYRFETRDFLSQSIRTPLVRRLETSRLRLTPRPISALRILVVLANPERTQMLDVAHEKRLIKKALGHFRGIDLQFLERPTIQRLRQRVRDTPFDVLHFAGHGGFDPEGEGFLCFEDEDRQESAVTGSVLANNLIGFGPITRLVFLNACKTARLPRDGQGRDPYLGVASALLMAGVPAVIAMQFPITDRSAASFSGKFYSALAQGDPLESAVAEARLALHSARPSSWEWATPVLFLGVPHGDLFQIAPNNEEVEAQEISSGDAATANRDSTEASDQGHTLESALEILDFERYDAALKALSQVLENEKDKTKVYYYRALARLGGRRPRSARPSVIHQVETDLWQAGQLSGGDEPAHIWLFRALIQHDYYRMNGLRITPPTVEEMMNEARVARVDEDPTYLKRLLHHAPTPPNLVRQMIEAKLLTLRDQ